MLRLLLLCAGVAAAHEAVLAFGPRLTRRKELFRRASERALELGLPLLVVGDPDTGFVTRFFGRAYGCGDLCTDLTGCPKCPHGIAGRLEDVLPRLRARSHVVFVSCTLEYVDDLPSVVRELERVSVPGGLFVATVEPGSLTNLFYLGGSNWELDSAPPDGPFRYRQIGRPRAALPSRT